MLEFLVRYPVGAKFSATELLRAAQQLDLSAQTLIDGGWVEWNGALGAYVRCRCRSSGSR
jgi:hypothetical protein